ncbi:MAG: HD domain-containing phosphohydrolase [Chloroflexota bacterium]|nr:HD domain-containing phosphohydrolase [Chloroflexota bacterium]
MQKDIATACGNPERVAVLAGGGARAINLPRRTAALLELASYLHDVGKLYVPEQILFKPAALSPRERNQIKTHVAAGAVLVANLRLPGEVVTIVSQHHERFDGSGYPLRLKGAEIHIGAKILAVADVIEALTSPRPYRKALPLRRALEFVNEGSGSQFDPMVVDALTRYLSCEKGGCPCASVKTAPPRTSL